MKTASLILVFALIYVLSLLSDAGVFRAIVEVPFGICTKIGPVIGPEDLTRIGDKVYISSDARDESGNQGSIFEYDLKTKKIINLTGAIHLPFSFHPHGIDLSLYGANPLLYVINHLDAENTRVEVFQINDKITYLKSLENPLFQSANDLVITGPEQFYITSDFGTTNKLWQKLQMYARLKTGYVSFFDKGSVTKILDGLLFANGITKDSQDKIFVAALAEQKIYSLDRQSVTLDGSPDNISWRDGKLYAALHPKLFSLKAQNEDRTKKAPSKIVEIGGQSSKVIYENSGDEISSASVALSIDDHRLIIGSVFDDHILDCSK